ncbi:MAG: single-stranded-DNA-specific exonuclease RecJ [Verrucomicrobiae bacterium]|nr:single-stranded-DNA-specific exonuclease RecJ [Verrucomicrobiae bacterium]
MKHRWLLAPPRPEEAAHLARELGITPLLGQCLINRDFGSTERAQAFLGPRLRDLQDPFLLPNMAAAVDRLWAAREAGESLVIYGDYDVDGVTATALLAEVLETLGWRVARFVPKRMDEGYGLSADGVENCLHQNRATLMVAVDCGSTATETIRSLAERGIDVLVFDHHQIADPPPVAVALVNPRLGGDGAHGVELSSVGLSFKLAHALVKRGRERGMPEAVTFDLKTLLDLVALGTIADLVPLRAENRILVRAGLERLNQTQRPGLQALCEVAQITSTIGSYEVGFLLSPRLNAAGRLEDACEALDLLLTDDYGTATRLARSLDARNRQRQQIEKAMADKVLGELDARFDPQSDYVIVEGAMPWHIGVVGIVASRVLQRFYRPTIIMGGDGECWRGSGRSIEGFDLAAALRDCDDLLLRHGGHAMAAGLSLAPENLAMLRDRLNQLARDRLRPEQLRPPLRLDAAVPLGQVTEEQVLDLDQLRPNGQGNPAVQLIVQGARHDRPPQRVGKERQHAKFWVTDGRLTREAIWYGAGDRPVPTEPFDLACVAHIHEFNHRRSVQLKVLDWRPAAKNGQRA